MIKLLEEPQNGNRDTFKTTMKLSLGNNLLNKYLYLNSVQLIKKWSAGSEDIDSYRQKVS